MRNILLTVIAGTSLTILGMAATEPRQATPEHKMDMSMMQACPMKLAGTDLSVRDVKDGIVVTLTTTSGDLAELRRRTEVMAKMHSGSSSADIHGGMMPFSLKYEEVVNGARLTLAPKDSATLEEFRVKVRQHAELMKKGNCAMMQDVMPGMMGGMKGTGTEPVPAQEPKTKPDETDHSAHHPGGELK
jgi:hypothetical protein